MKTELVLSCLAVLGQCNVLNQLFARQTSSGSDQTYLTSVCSPNVTSGILPPCISVINIQGQCAPNDTTPLGYLAMAECLCLPPSTFFSDWLGCRKCLEYHGGLSQNALARYSTVLSSISNAMCTGTPTASFADYFTSIDGAVPAATTGATSVSDQAVSQTAVSLYYTLSGSQGPGVITGSATAATATGGGAAATSGGTGGTSGTASATISGGSATSSSTSRSGSSSGGAPTAGFGLHLAFAVAGGAAAIL